MRSPPVLKSPFLTGVTRLWPGPFTSQNENVGVAPADPAGRTPAGTPSTPRPGASRRDTSTKQGPTNVVLGRTAITLEPVQVPDITVPGAYESRLRENLIESGIRAILAVPMVRE